MGPPRTQTKANEAGPQMGEPHAGTYRRGRQRPNGLGPC